MATDIAFCVSALVLLGRLIPQALTIFLVSLAIVDDIGAVIVIAAFYTQTIHLPSLGWAAAVFAVLVAFNLSGVRRSLPYALAGGLLWTLMYKSGFTPRSRAFSLPSASPPVPGTARICSAQR